MARKKVVFVIVEGPSDEETLGVILTRIYDRDVVHVEVTHCDLTTEKRVTPSNIILKICGMIKDYARANHFTRDDFKKIVHIVDTDGAYIPNRFLYEDPAAAGTRYCPTGIYTSSKEGIEQRNAQKSANLSKLYKTGQIWSLPYRVFYMSCNLDHVLYDRLNTTDEEKERNSLQFAKKYRNCIPEFLSFIQHSEFSVMTGYRDSWEYIRTELHSLERHANLGLCFEPDPK